MNPVTLVLLAVGITVVGEWAVGNDAGVLAKEGITTPWDKNKKAPAGTVIVSGFIAAVVISMLADAGAGPRKVAFGLATLLLVGAVLGPGTGIFVKLGLIQSPKK